MLGMSPFEQEPGAGREDLQPSRPASGQPRASRRRASGAADNAAALEESIHTWEAAYRRYGQASTWSTQFRDRDPAALWQVASASSDVAAAWREIAAVGRLPWWTLAAVESAAQAFETQAREWEATEEQADTELAGEGHGDW